MAWWRCSVWRWRLPRCVGLQVALRHDLSARIRQIRKRLDEISANRAAYHIEHAPSPAWAASSATTLAAWDDLEECTVGFGKYSDMLREQLLDLDAAAAVPGRALVSIVGESSIGKTTLARKVYQSPEVRNHFEIRTWTVLPPNSRPANVLRDIHTQASSQLRRSASSQGQTQAAAEDSNGCCDRPASGKEKDISNALFRNLTGRRYLVVVDGSISVTDWNSLRASLPDEGNGSRVLLVTDSAGLEVVGYGPASYEPIELTRLSPENTYEVFRRRVFGHGGGDCPGRHKSRYYQDVFRITRGLPLSVVVLAGVLRSKELPAEWDQVMAQLLPASKNGIGNGAGARRIMSLAFDDLPHHLKSCFLYLAAMPESGAVDAQRLVRLWVAEGFVRPRRGSTMEEVAQGYLKELISRCMVQLVRKDEFGAVIQVSVHDRLHAFAQDEAQEACFVETHDSTADVLAPATVRRLAVQSLHDLGGCCNALPKLRTIVCDWGAATKPTASACDLGFLHASKFLRVIDIHGLDLRKLPNEIGSMIHIRYLGLQCGQLEKLPNTISKLVNLQSLILKGRNGVGVLGVTAAFWTIPTLRHVVAPFALPGSLGDALYSLQTLHGVQPHGWDTRRGGGVCNPLGRATNLRSLELSGLTALHAGALTAALESLDLLVHLVLQGESLPRGVFSIPSLRRLQSLRLVGPIEQGSGSAGDEEEEEEDVDVDVVRYIRPNLTRLSMWGTMVGQGFVGMLGELPSLAELTLMWGAYDGERMAFSGFRSLQKLKLGLPELEEWAVSAGAMAALARLTLLRCAELRVLPEALAGMKELEEVVLYSMPKMVGRIKEEGGEDHHKIKHVPVIQTIW